MTHRDLKSELGIHEAQVWNQDSVQRYPAFIAAAYSLLCLSAIEVFGDRREADFGPQPRWQRRKPRFSCRDLIALLSQEIREHPEELAHLGIKDLVVA